MNMRPKDHDDLAAVSIKDLKHLKLVGVLPEVLQAVVVEKRGRDVHGEQELPVLDQTPLQLSLQPSYLLLSTF